ncbi:MAG: hypothetical protein LBC75_08525 [Fibromonadaceae bacterium]|jgi:hypothetical protein|nr:hypothetical protein [Fibromonadaceae bacterium]
MAKFNELVWKNEYCFSDKKVATCPGGRVGNIYTMKSTDPVNDRCPTKALACSWGKASECLNEAGCSNIVGPGLCSNGGCYAWDNPGTTATSGTHCLPTNKFRCNTYNGFTDNNGTYQGDWKNGPALAGGTAPTFANNPNNTGTCTDPTLTTTLLCTAIGAGPTDMLNGLGGWSYDRTFAETRECKKTGVSGVGVESCPNNSGADDADEWETTKGECKWTGTCAANSIAGGTSATLVDACTETSATLVSGACAERDGKSASSMLVSQVTCRWIDVPANSGADGCATNKTGSGSWSATEGVCEKTITGITSTTAIPSECTAGTHTATAFAPTAGTCSANVTADDCSSLSGGSFGYKATAGTCTWTDTEDTDCGTGWTENTNTCSWTENDACATDIPGIPGIPGTGTGTCTATGTTFAQCKSVVTGTWGGTTAQQGKGTCVHTATIVAADDTDCEDDDLGNGTLDGTAGTCTATATDATDTDNECGGLAGGTFTFKATAGTCDYGTKTATQCGTGAGNISGTLAAGKYTKGTCTQTGVAISTPVAPGGNLTTAAVTACGGTVTIPATTAGYTSTQATCVWSDVTNTQCVTAGNVTASAETSDACTKEDVAYVNIAACGSVGAKGGWKATEGTCTWADKQQTLCTSTLTGTWDATTASSKTTCTVAGWAP